MVRLSDEEILIEDDDVNNTVKRGTSQNLTTEEVLEEFNVEATTSSEANVQNFPEETEFEQPDFGLYVDIPTTNSSLKRKTETKIVSQTNRPMNTQTHHIYKKILPFFFEQKKFHCLSRSEERLG
jgi:purine-nucleoside phosphorylase